MASTPLQPQRDKYAVSSAIRDSSVGCVQETGRGEYVREAIGVLSAELLRIRMRRMNGIVGSSPRSRHREGREGRHRLDGRLEPYMAPGRE